MESIWSVFIKHSHNSIMADLCTHISSVEELSLYCRWEKDGVQEEHFLEITLLQKADAQNIYSVLIEYLKQKNLQVSTFVVMGFDGACMFSGQKTGVQTHVKTLTPHALFVVCHWLWLACVQAANSTPGIKHAYTTFVALLKFFPFLPKENRIP